MPYLVNKILSDYQLTTSITLHFSCFYIIHCHINFNHGYALIPNHFVFIKNTLGFLL